MLRKRAFSIKKKRSALIIILTVSFLFLFTLLIDQKLKLHLAMNPFYKKEFVTNILAASSIKPSEGRNIFFHETSGLFKLNARQACAVESAGIYFIHICNLISSLIMR